MTKIFVFDETGKQLSINSEATILRREILINLLTDKGVDAELWNGTQELDRICFVLAHKNDLSTYQETTLIQSAE